MTAFQAASAEMYNATQGQAGPQPGADFGGAQGGAQSSNNQQGAAEDVDFEEVK
jgi:molecular chaperone DnaK